MSSPNNDQLMQEIGSKEGYDPIPPRQHMRLMESKDPVEQAMAWVYFNTIRYRSPMEESIPTRTPYACDAFGRALETKDLAAHYHWTVRKARRAIEGAVKKGWVRKAEGKFWLCADFPVARPVLSEDGPAEAPPKDPVASYIETLPPYQKTAVAAMPRAKQMQYVANRVEFEDWRKRAMAEAVALVREKTEPVGDRINVAFKVPVLRAEKKPHTQTFIQLELFGEPLLNLSKLAIFDGQRVNGHAQSSAVLNPNGTAPPSTAPSARPADPHPPMPTGASVGAKSSDRAPRTSAESAPPPGLVSQPRPRALTAEQLGPIDAAMRQVCSPASRDVNLLFGHCRDFAPDCTPEEVAHFVRQTVIKAKRNRVENWIGFLLRGVPPNFESPGFEAWRVQRQDSEMVTLPGFSSMPRAEAIALLREYEHAEEQDVRSFAREHLVKLLGITEVA